MNLTNSDHAGLFTVKLDRWLHHNSMRLNRGSAPLRATFPFSLDTLRKNWLDLSNFTVVNIAAAWYFHQRADGIVHSITMSYLKLYEISNNYYRHLKLQEYAAKQNAQMFLSIPAAFRVRQVLREETEIQGWMEFQALQVSRAGTVWKGRRANVWRRGLKSRGNPTISSAPGTLSTTASTWAKLQ